MYNPLDVSNNIEYIHLSCMLFLPQPQRTYNNLIQLKPYTLQKSQLAAYVTFNKPKRQSAPNCEQTSFCPNGELSVISLVSSP